MSSGFFYTHEIPMTFHPNLHLSQHLDFHIVWISNKVVQSELCHKQRKYIVFPKLAVVTKSFLHIDYQIERQTSMLACLLTLICSAPLTTLREHQMLTVNHLHFYIFPSIKIYFRKQIMIAFRL